MKTMLLNSIIPDLSKKKVISKVSIKTLSYLNGPMSEMFVPIGN